MSRTFESLRESHPNVCPDSSPAQGAPIRDSGGSSLEASAWWDAAEQIPFVEVPQPGNTGTDGADKVCMGLNAHAEPADSPSQAVTNQVVVDASSGSDHPFPDWAVEAAHELIEVSRQRRVATIAVVPITVDERVSADVWCLVGALAGSGDLGRLLFVETEHLDPDHSTAYGPTAAAGWSEFIRGCDLASLVHTTPWSPLHRIGPGHGLFHIDDVTHYWRLARLSHEIRRAYDLGLIVTSVKARSTPARLTVHACEAAYLLSCGDAGLEKEELECRMSLEAEGVIVLGVIRVPSSSEQDLCCARSPSDGRTQ